MLVTGFWTAWLFFESEWCPGRIGHADGEYSTTDGHSLGGIDKASFVLVECLCCNYDEDWYQDIDIDSIFR